MCPMRGSPVAEATGERLARHPMPRFVLDRTCGRLDHGLRGIVFGQPWLEPGETGPGFVFTLTAKGPQARQLGP